MESKRSNEVLLRWLLASGCGLVLMFFFSPPWGAFLAWSRVPELGGLIEVRRGASVLFQMAHLGAEIPDKLHGAIQWRLLFPALGHVLGLSPVLFFALSPAGCLLVLAYIVTVLRRHGLGWLETALMAVTLGATSWFFSSMSWLGYFDSWLVLALLFVTFARARWVVWLACSWAPWIDERFVMAAPLAMICRYLHQTRTSATEPAIRHWKQELAVPAALVAVFLVVRLGFLSGHSGTNATISGYMGGLKVIGTPLSRVAFGVWEGMRVGWVFVAAAVLCGGLKRWQAVALASSVVVVVLASLATAQDFSRSMMFMMPVALLGAVLAGGAVVERWSPLALRVGAAAALLLPAHLVMNDGVNPVFYLYHELAALRSPPPVIMPEIQELRGIEAMERGEYAEAMEALSLAIKLAPHPTGAAKHRGLLSASLGHWADAKKDFSTMVDSEPANPDGWFLRAQAELALGDAQAARADVEQARSRASSDWSSRPDVARFLTRLNQALGGK